MRHLETKREAAERRRVALMSKGISTFLEMTSKITGADLHEPEIPERRKSYARGLEGVYPGPTWRRDLDPEPAVSGDGDGRSDEAGGNAETVLDKIKLTLDRAACILRESLELTVGGVVFLDTTLGHSEPSVTNSYIDISSDNKSESDGDFGSESKKRHSSHPSFSSLASSAIFGRGSSSPGQTRAFNDQYQPAKILATSVSNAAKRRPSARTLDGKTLQSLIKTYPKGNVWYIDDEGYFSSLEQVDELSLCEEENIISMRGSGPVLDVTRRRAEANLLSKVFEKARQIIFLPLWDAGNSMYALALSQFVHTHMHV